MTGNSTSARQPWPSRRQPRQRRPGPFPVTVTRPAVTTTAALTAAQRYRRSVANQVAAELTDAARQGRLPYIDASRMPTCRRSHAAGIIATASRLAADPTPGTLRIGRDLRGHPVAVLLHADTWSLLLREARHDHAPRSWVFLDGHDTGYDPTDAYFHLDHDSSALGVAWTGMVHTILAITT